LPGAAPPGHSWYRSRWLSTHPVAIR